MPRATQKQLQQLLWRSRAGVNSLGKAGWFYTDSDPSSEHGCTGGFLGSALRCAGVKSGAMPWRPTEQQQRQVTLAGGSRLLVRTQGFLAGPLRVRSGADCSSLTPPLIGHI